jgi:hypothetical protein
MTTEMDEAAIAFGIAVGTQKLERTPLGHISRTIVPLEEHSKLLEERVGVDDGDELTPPSSPALSSQSSVSMTLSPPEVDVPHSSPLRTVEEERTQDLPSSTPTDHSRIRVSAKKPPLTPKSVRRNQLAQSVCDLFVLISIDERTPLFNNTFVSPFYCLVEC